MLEGDSINTVEPIRDKSKVLDIAEYLREQSERNYVLFVTGVNSGLRISDILNLKVRDVRDKDYISLREKKTGKEKRFPINADLKKALREYVKGKSDYEYLFCGRADKQLTRQQAYNILSEAGNRFGLDSIGTHTLRKTFGYHMYQATKDAALLMQIFNHASVDITLRYIGINQNTINKAYNKLSFFS